MKAATPNARSRPIADLGPDVHLFVHEKGALVFRLMRLRPPHGWPAVWWELVIVTLGVLIALGAQQALDTIRWKSDVTEFRRAMDHELGYDFGAYRDRLGQSAGISRRLDELEQWLGVLQTGAQVRLTTRIHRPITTSLRTAVWESRTSEVTGHLGLDTRLAYASFYDEVRNYSEVRDLERAVWNELLDFGYAASLSQDDRVRLRGLIERGRLFDRLIVGNWPEVERRGAEAGIRAWTDPNALPGDPGICVSLRWEPV
jgi:hypothetical protein